MTDRSDFLKDLYLIQGMIYRKYESNALLVSSRITVTRSLGDAAAQRIGVICEPSVASFTLDESIKYIILATDGLWDGISIEECASIISATAIEERDASKCAAVLLQKGLEGLATRKIDDNLTHIVCSYPI